MSVAAGDLLLPSPAWGQGGGRGVGCWSLQAGSVQLGISYLKTKEGQGPLFLDCAFGQFLFADVNNLLAEHPEYSRPEPDFKESVLLSLPSNVIQSLGKKILTVSPET